MGFGCLNGAAKGDGIGGGSLSSGAEEKLWMDGVKKGDVGGVGEKRERWS